MPSYVLSSTRDIGSPGNTVHGIMMRATNRSMTMLKHLLERCRHCPLLPDQRRRLYSPGRPYSRIWRTQIRSVESSIKMLEIADVFRSKIVETAGTEGSSWQTSTG